VINNADSDSEVKLLGTGDNVTYDQFADGTTSSYWNDAITITSSSNRD
jgi:hypothetical protein